MKERPSVKANGSARTQRPRGRPVQTNAHKAKASACMRETLFGLLRVRGGCRSSSSQRREELRGETEPGEESIKSIRHGAVNLHAQGHGDKDLEDLIPNRRPAAERLRVFHPAAALATLDSTGSDEKPPSSDRAAGHRRHGNGGRESGEGMLGSQAAEEVRSHVRELRVQVERAILKLDRNHVFVGPGVLRGVYSSSRQAS